MPTFSRNALLLITSLCLVFPAIAADPKPAWLREPSPQELEQRQLREQEREREAERKQAEHDRKTELRKVCEVLLKPFASARGEMSAGTKVAAELLLDYHKAGVSCFELQDSSTQEAMGSHG